ncbi:nucleotidyltransferase [Peribacillus tepidiphilus]|uniref:nucleotidyltransferase n=1 Tax=Peribacillus tepidiphilus TaxID=2652445 RepID=UPI001781BB29|nr:nucleotidyltransferase [Peribacillus tepidiphilus]
MKAVGLVVEYNPFHNGHQYHLHTSKNETNADVVIAVMSGSFLQRGEPALVSKWTRTEMALRGGADLVFELPYVYCTQHAEHFAYGAILLLEAAGCDTFCFGSEQGKIEPFLSLYQLIKEKKAEYDQYVVKYISEGNSYPKASSLAFYELVSDVLDLPDLTKPNNILGFQYVKAALDHSFRIKPCTIRRIHSDYHDQELPDQPIASATSIRKALMRQQDLESTSSYLPSESFLLLRSYGEFHDWEKYWPLLKYKIMSSSTDELEAIYEAEEGIQYRMKENVLEASSFNEFVSKVKTKRYTWTRIQRLCVHILNHVKKEQMKSAMNQNSYLRILGMTEKGRKYLNLNKKKIELPLISRISSVQHLGLELDISSAFIHSLALDFPSQKKLRKREFQPPIFL